MHEEFTPYTDINIQLPHFSGSLGIIAHAVCIPAIGPSLNLHDGSG